ncbi:MAG: hypothetical protein GY867_05820 [bacterium]|nr:hypothetical protein [bacterium]
MNEIVIGIDSLTEVWCEARLDDETGRPVITQLADGLKVKENGGSLGREGRVVVAVPDAEVQVKRLQLAGADDGSRRNHLLFELVQSVLEDEQAFVYDVHPAGHKDSWFGLIFRRRALEKLTLDCGLAGAEVASPLDFLPRSMALGRAYLNFCRQEEGDLVCLVDLSRRAASVCLIKEGKIVDLASLALPANCLDSAVDREQLAVDLKTVVSFRLSSMMDRGVSSPLSNLILSGQVVSDDLRQVVQKYFPVGVKAPSINPGYLTDEVRESEPSPERFLVALGLTVN